MSITFESQRQRTIVGRVERGADLIPSLLDACATHHVRCGELRALGAFESVEVCEYDQQGKVYRPARRLAAAYEILSLYGNVSEKDGEPFVHAHVTLSREQEGRIEVVGGHLVGGRVFSCEIVITAWDDLQLRRSRDPATGLALWEGTGEPRTARAAGWGEVIAASLQKDAAGGAAAVPGAAKPRATPAHGHDEAVEATADDAEEITLAPGDLLVHPAFGRCVVERVEGNHEFAAVRLPSRRLVRLSLDALDVRAAGRDGTRRVFAARVK